MKSDTKFAAMSTYLDCELSSHVWFDIHVKNVGKPCTSLGRKTSGLLKLSVPNTEVSDLRPEKSMPGKSGLFWMNYSKHCAFFCVFMAADLKVTQ